MVSFVDGWEDCRLRGNDGETGVDPRYAALAAREAGAR
jgi:hypothetical protein